MYSFGDEILKIHEAILGISGKISYLQRGFLSKGGS
jgi:hypothetical protein